MEWLSLRERVIHGKWNGNALQRRPRSRNWRLAATDGSMSFLAPVAIFFRKNRFNMELELYYASSENCKYNTFSKLLTSSLYLIARTKIKRLRCWSSVSRVLSKKKELNWLLKYFNLHYSSLRCIKSFYLGVLLKAWCTGLPALVGICYYCYYYCQNNSRANLLSMKHLYILFTLGIIFVCSKSGFTPRNNSNFHYI